MADISLLDRSYQKDNSKNYHLSIQVDPDGVGFCILDLENKHYIGFRKYSFEITYNVETLTDKLEQIIDEDDCLDTLFGSSSAIFLTQKSTFVPDIFFEEVNLRDYFEFKQVLEELDEIHSDKIEEIKAWNVFAIPTYIANLLYNKFRGIHYFHQATPLVKTILKDFSSPSSIHLNLNNRFFDIAVKQNGKLILYNTFLYQNETDLLYYVLFIINQLKIEPQTIPMTLCGELSDRVAYQEALSKYVPNLMYLDPALPSFSGIFERINRHKYFNLFYLYNCE